MPADPAIKTLWLGNVNPSEVSEKDIFDAVFSFGQIVRISLLPTGNCAFVEFESREMAEFAASQLFKALVIKGAAVHVNWAKTSHSGNANKSGSSFGEDLAASALLAPPGLQLAPVSQYALAPGFPKRGRVEDGTVGVMKAMKVAPYASMEPHRLGTSHSEQATSR